MLLCCAAGATTAADLSANFNRLILKGSAELPREPGATRVETLATGDFNCDNMDDLAVGDEFGGDGGGSISIAFGDRFMGFRTGGQLIDQDTPGVIGAAEPGDSFGSALAADDFDADGCSDLAIGVPGEDDGSAGTTDSGGANVLFGAAGGLNGDNDLFVPGTESAPHGHTTGHFKGEALVSLDNWTSTGSQPFLAISAIGYSPNLLPFAGGVTVRRGGAAPLATPVDFVERGDFPGESNRQNGRFGFPLAAGDFNNDGFDDLVAHTSHEGCILPSPTSCFDQESAVWVVYGATGSAGFVYERITQNSPGVPGSVNSAYGFGEAFAVGDFNNDGEDDLAVGAPYEDIGTIARTGTVTILYGATSRLLANAGSSIAFDQSDIVGAAAEADDNFGAALASGDFNRDGFDDLASGIPREGFGAIVAGGSVVVVYGSASGINTATSKVFDLGTTGIAGNVEANDAFGDTPQCGRLQYRRVECPSSRSPGTERATCSGLSAATRSVGGDRPAFGFQQVTPPSSETAMCRPLRYRVPLLAATLALVLMPAPRVLGQAAGGAFVLRTHTIDAGGGSVTGSGFAATTTIAQADANAALAGGVFVIRGGFWPTPTTRNEILFIDGFEP